MENETHTGTSWLKAAPNPVDLTSSGACTSGQPVVRTTQVSHLTVI